MLKKIIKMIWADGENKNFSVIENADFAFNLLLGKFLIGILSFHDNKWHFSYSDDFKAQNSVLPLINFPSKNKEYISDHLWSFFASRIPSLAQRQMKEEKNDDVYYLLEKYGKNVIVNPYVLLPVSN